MYLKIRVETPEKLLDLSVQGGTRTRHLGNVLEANRNVGGAIGEETHELDYPVKQQGRSSDDLTAG